MADLQDRMGTAERRLAEVSARLTALEHEIVDESEAIEALSRFEPVWEELSPKEQARVIRLLVRRVEYDGTAVSITFHPGGMKQLAAEVAA